MFPLTDIVHLDDQQSGIFALCMNSKGNRQFLGNPFGFDWTPKITSYFGYRINPISGEKNHHKGIDIGVPIGTNILAIHDGIVTTVLYDPNGYGRYIIIEGSDDLQSKYAHCDTLLVSKGQEVMQGDVIAKSGNTGSSTGPHLHLEVLRDGKYINPVYFVKN